VLPDVLFDDPPEEDEPLLPELAAPAPLEDAAFELLVEFAFEEPLAGLLPELSDDAPDWLPDASLEPALASPPEAAAPPAAASEPATGTAASLVLAPPLPLLRKSVTYQPEPFN
jgi:hypothetical protein